MSSQPSQTRIANRALTLIGTGKRILDLDDSAPEARVMLALFADTRDAVLADHPWNFAIRRKALPADVKPPAFGYANSYTLPGDCLRWLPSPRGALDWRAVEQEGAALLSDAAAPLPIRYVARVVDVAQWSQGFVEALAWRLASEAAEPLTADKPLGDRLRQGYADALSRAKRQDGLATGDTIGGETAAASSWLAARGGYADYGWGGWDAEAWRAP